MFDAQECASALVLDIQTMFALGESIDALSLTQSREKRRFQEDLLFAVGKIVQHGFRGPLRYLSSRKTFHQSCERIRNYVSMTLESKGRIKSEQKSESEVSQSFNQTMDILLASDTMATTLSGLFYSLARDERVARKLRKSIVDTIGTSPPSWEQLGTLHYVRWVLQEGKCHHLASRQLVTTC